MTCCLDNVPIFLGEVACLSPLGVKGLKGFKGDSIICFKGLLILRFFNFNMRSTYPYNIEV